MPSRLDTNYPRPTDPDEFESMILDICALEWDDPDTEKFGRKGQKQFGVDVYGRPIDQPGKYRAAQCKLRTKGSSLSESDIEAEIAEARQFPHELAALIIVTDGPRDSHVQILIDKISEREVSSGSFRVVIWFWENITERLAAYPRLKVKYYRDYFANLTNLPIIENLIDVPLQVVITHHGTNHKPNRLEEALKFRGIRLLREIQPQDTYLSNIVGNSSPDGIIGVYHPTEKIATKDILLKFASGIQAQIQQVEKDCPIFVILPASLIAQFVQCIDMLDDDPRNIKVLDSEKSLNDIADNILNAVFQYGYARRGGLKTIDISARTREGQLRSVLLDLDWQSRLSTTVFPSTEAWQDYFIPALGSIRKELLHQSDIARIQICSQLPIPAAIALGFFFNIRVSHIGVWARKTGTSDFKQQFWLSDASPANLEYQPVWFRQGDEESQSAIIELTTYVSIHKAVEMYICTSGLSADIWVQMRLEVDGKPFPFIDEDHAVAFASQVGQLIRHLNERGVTDIYLFARIPSALGVLIGQRLQACGRIHLYWFDNPSYHFGFTLS